MVAVGCCQSGEGEERSQDHFVVVVSSRLPGTEGGIYNSMASHLLLVHDISQIGSSRSKPEKGRSGKKR